MFMDEHYNLTVKHKKKITVVTFRATKARKNKDLYNKKIFILRYFFPC